MVRKRKTIIYCGSILILCLLIHQVMSNTGVLSNMELINIANGSVVRLADDTCRSMWWEPKTQITTLYKVTYWLHQAKSYKGKVPLSQYNGAFHKENIGPSILYISTWDKHKISIQPSFFLDSDGNVRFVTDVLQLNNDGHISYIQSSQLYNWLKNDKWKTQFERMQ
jgi:hypothetical protein